MTEDTLPFDHESVDETMQATPATNTSAPDNVAPSDADNFVPPTPSDDVGETLNAIRKEAEKNLDGWQRARAEFANYKKRVERERIDMRENAILDVVKALLPAIDDFERSVENIPDELRDNPWIEGTVAIERKLKRLLEQYDIELIDPLGDPFNPDFHQGLGVDSDSEYESGHVSATLQRGYKKGDKVLRPALVRVAE